MQDKPVALVTGANQGIGLQIVKISWPMASLCWPGRAISSARGRGQRSWWDATRCIST